MSSLLQRRLFPTRHDAKFGVLSTHGEALFGLKFALNSALRPHRTVPPIPALFVACDGGVLGLGLGDFAGFGRRSSPDGGAGCFLGFLRRHH